MIKVALFCQQEKSFPSITFRHIFDRDIRKGKSMSKANATMKKWKEAYQQVSGPVKIPMTNDYLFKAFLQENKKALMGLISALLHLPRGKVRRVKVENPIVLGEQADEKTVILDLNVTFNDDSRINLELQVVNEDNWAERSVYYGCRNFTDLNKGDVYENIKPLYQIGIVDFTLFSNQPVFYATYELCNRENGQLYTDKFSIGVLDLTQIRLATEEDKKYNINKWAALFKARTWEEIKMIAKQDKAISEAAYTIYKISEDERIRQECEARERYLLKEKAAKKKERAYIKAQKENEKLKQQLVQANDEVVKLKKENEELRKRVAGNS